MTSYNIFPSFLAARGIIWPRSRHLRLKKKNLLGIYSSLLSSYGFHPPTLLTTFLCWKEEWKMYGSSRSVTMRRKPTCYGWHNRKIKEPRMLMASWSHYIISALDDLHLSSLLCNNKQTNKKTFYWLKIL